MSVKQLAHRDIRHVRWRPGSKTSISVELPIWDYFCIIAAERGVTIGELLDHVNRTCRLEPTITGKMSVRNLSSAVRVFVVNQCILKPQPKPNPRVKWVK
jgi:predicted DNA-binding ribbon-helix-helix protein